MGNFSAEREQDVTAVFAERAMAGDGQFAIAYAILRLAGEHRTLQQNLTFGDPNDPNRVQGVFEKIAMEIADIHHAIEDRA